MHNKKTLKRTFLNYSKAIEKLEARGFKTFSLNGGGYTFYIGESWKSNGGNYIEADKVYITIEALFEYGRPKLIEPSWWIYNSSFMSICLSAIEPYNLVALDGGKVRNNQHNITVVFKELSYGISDWATNKQEIITVASLCKEHIKEQILDALKKADNEVSTWRDAKQKLLSISI